ncbi:MAG: hypothetical protein A2725_03730 [Candidatus Magasanikbacteria bacterium RIFCSPHIGHO2_01_FULL_33_34]|uniref:ECF transporter S component n=1 Tax=Candidatus Magasanikbacteria bacterium RIFCSPHIGHO2_01_FULL_33_34 TaxID=1798671 RepID=A0A1F6LHP4_9BACT|nr:MAG: hypothetical protein A2725_03730 [Candidatus Magasanikbacteria bacterium RIFCSPHIGHO2_01_FULL_33_34]OGH65082.1 MAG: hypothetical protein A3B83_03490 [Candidatus Magasanikbacteria bacterium RIFCSPHIGHO2_02_FULL_33_17]OGH75375.1 MAG: hypothetical protein A3A89_04675 [Candidatus Magasanikbacteria bacterium RIFCSPLOWO2_01_FULL_33_34]OGH82329.1 MAG: hypothetical protein A3F93_02445 [Candidatus Magasanikbacteria bacterium RIFCSPLOWO2_12_FULL_34_7]
MNKNNYIILYFLLAIGITFRFLPHTANFVPIGAIAIFSGLYFPKKYAIIIPVIALIISDFFIGFYSWQIMLSVYGSFVIMGLLGLLARKNKSFGKIAGATILGSLIFFLITNASVWIFGTMYSHSISGLIESYYMALPFFKNSLMGDIFYTFILVGTTESVLYYQNKKSTKQSINI